MAMFVTNDPLVVRLSPDGASGESRGLFFLLSMLTRCHSQDRISGKPARGSLRETPSVRSSSLLASD